MPPVIMSNDMIEIIPYGSIMDFSHIVTLQLPGLIKQARQIHIKKKKETSPLISLGVLSDDRCTITIHQKDMSVQENGQETIKGARNNKNLNVGCAPGNTTTRSCDE